MAEQEQALATGLHGLSKRVGLQLWVTAIALVVAITAIVIGLA